MTRRRWDSHELRTLRALYPLLTATELQPILRRPVTSIYQQANWLRIAKHPEYWARMRQIQRDRALTDARLISGRFHVGQVPANKGRPMSPEVRAKSSATWFKPGTLNGRAARLYKPVGALRLDKDGTLQRKYTTAGRGGQRWRSEHTLVWERAHGPVPSGHIVVFKPGMRTNVEAEITLDRLELISHAENMARNTIQNLPEPLRRAMQLRGVLNRQIKRHSPQPAEAT